MVYPLSPILAVAPGTQRAIFIYLGLIVALAVVMVIVALLVRRRVMGEQYEPESFSLSDLRRLHAAGELSDAEFEAARGKMIAQHKSMLLHDPAKGILPEQPDKDSPGDAAAGAG